MLNAVCPDTSRGEEPELSKIEANRGMGATAEVDYLTSREPREVRRSHLNYVVPARKSASKGYDPREQNGKQPSAGSMPLTRVGNRAAGPIGL